VRSKDRDHHRALKLRAGESKALIWDFRLRAGSTKFLIRVFNSKQERLLRHIGFLRVAPFWREAP
jgi:hypothetical protein